METVIEFMYRITGIIIFCAAVTVLLLNISNIHTVTNVTKETIVENDNMYAVSETEVRDINYVTRDELKAYLLGGIKEPVEIDGVTLKANNFSPETFNYDFINSEYYKKAPQYDSDGAIVSIKFTSCRKGE